MGLTKKQFDILEAYTTTSHLTQRGALPGSLQRCDDWCFKSEDGIVTEEKLGICDA